MKFIADFHVHSKFSRATALNSDLEHLYVSAQIKGITVIGTGDFTHPAWWQEIQEKLEPAEEGLFTLKKEFARECDRSVPDSCKRPVRFMLVTEISNIYKKDKRTRKNHNLVFLPDQKSAEKLIKRLDAVGNIRSDGRPILGLDAKHLLEIVLDIQDRGFLIPAHIWTPWFSLLGSKSGFDDVEACFEDLSEHIFALETGLSSDPPMNRRVSALDRFTLISNSDAHSPSKLGREANCFDTDLSYSAIHDAIKDADPQKFLGTIEFYPEEGKYHVDGHRKCGFRCYPHETRQLDCLCPVCGKPLTLGVLHRVTVLADRSEGELNTDVAQFHSLIALPELLSEVLAVGPKSKKVNQAYDQLVGHLGPELDILCDIPLDVIETSGIPLLGESIHRMRHGELHFNPGFDGEFGQVRIFKPGERQSLRGQQSLFDVPGEIVEKHSDAPSTEASTGTPRRFGGSELSKDERFGSLLLNEAQTVAVEYGPGPLIIDAGPGTGKTRTITCRMVALLEKGSVQPDHMLAVTFTNQAAQEMRCRLEEMLESANDLPTVATFHGFCLNLLKEIYEEQAGAVLDELGRRALIDDAIGLAAGDGHLLPLSPASMLDGIVQAKQQLLAPWDDLSAVFTGSAYGPACHIYRIYQRLLEIQNLYDYEDLLFHTVHLLEKDSSFRNTLQQRYVYIFVDEFQDINMAQYRLLRTLASHNANLCVIGDPDQAIYGFRGSNSRFFSQFQVDFNRCQSITLNQNYRSTDTILDAAHQMIQRSSEDPTALSSRIHSGIDGYPFITVLETASPSAEARAIGRTIERLVGGTGFYSVDFGKVDAARTEADCSFNDFGILCRTGRQAEFIAKRLTKADIPCQLASKCVRQESELSKLIACFRVITGKGSYVDLNGLTGLSSVGISKETLALFKQWAYAKQLSLVTALRTAKRIPIPGMSHRRQTRLLSLFDRLNQLARETATMDVAESLRHIAINTTLAARMDVERLDHLVALAIDYGHEAGLFSDSLALEQDVDLYHAGVEKVAVMTMHASKGLEFPIVFIAGCEAGLIPYDRPGSRPSDVDEERRLFYVAMTRAKKRLYCTWARKRTIYGRRHYQHLSSFIVSVEDHLIRCIKDQPKAQTPPQKQLNLF